MYFSIWDLVYDCICILIVFILFGIVLYKIISFVFDILFGEDSSSSNNNTVNITTTTKTTSSVSNSSTNTSSSNSSNSSSSSISSYSTSNSSKSSSYSSGYSSSSSNSTPKKKAPYVELYEAIKKSKRTGESVEYRYGTYVEDGKLYSKNGKKIRNKEAYFAVVEKRYQKKHGYDAEHMRRKEEHKKRVDEYLGR